MTFDKDFNQQARDDLLLTQKIMAHMSAWVIEEVQKYLGIASPERLRIPVPNYRYYHVDPGAKRVKLYINGENNRSEFIDVYFDTVTNTAEVYADSVQTFIRQERILDFDMLVIDPDKTTHDGKVETKVNFTEALERIPTWNAMPVPKFDEIPNRKPEVVGGVSTWHTG